MKLLSWNVCGMNSVSKRVVLKGMVQSFKGECLFLQETKMEVIDIQIIRSICLWSNSEFAMCPSIGASGGILLVWNAVYWQKMDEFVGGFTVSVLLKDVRCKTEWVATSVYGSSSSSNYRVEFCIELSRAAGL